MKTINIFRNLFVALFLLPLLAVWGCSDDEVSDSYTPEDLNLEVSSTNTTLDETGSAISFVIRTNGVWTIEGSDAIPWIEVMPKLSGKGSQNITLKATALAEGETTRSGSLVVKAQQWGVENGQTMSQTFEFTQTVVDRPDQTTLTIKELNEMFLEMKEKGIKERYVDDKIDKVLEAVIVSDNSINNGITIDKHDEMTPTVAIQLMDENASGPYQGINLWDRNNMLTHNNPMISKGKVIRLLMTHNLTQMLIIDDKFVLTGGEGISKSWVGLEDTGRTADVQPLVVKANELEQYRSMLVTVENCTTPDEAVGFCYGTKEGLVAFSTPEGEVMIGCQKNTRGFSDKTYLTGQTDAVTGLVDMRDGKPILRPQSVQDIRSLMGGEAPWMGIEFTVPQIHEGIEGKMWYIASTTENVIFRNMIVTMDGDLVNKSAFRDMIYVKSADENGPKQGLPIKLSRRSPYYPTRKALKMGDVIEIMFPANFSRVDVNRFNGGFTINGDQMKVHILGHRDVVPVEVANPTNDNLGDYLGMYVKLPNVTSPAAGGALMGEDINTRHQFTQGQGGTFDVLVNNNWSEVVDDRFKPAVTGTLYGYPVFDDQVPAIVPSDKQDIQEFLAPPLETIQLTIPELLALAESMPDNSERYIDEQHHIEVMGVVAHNGTDYIYQDNTLYVYTEGNYTPGNYVTIFNYKAAPYALKHGEVIKMILKGGKAKFTKNERGLLITNDFSSERPRRYVDPIGPFEITADKLADYVGLPVIIKNATSPSTGAPWFDGQNYKHGFHTFTTPEGEFKVIAHTQFRDYRNPDYSIKPVPVSRTGSIGGLVVIWDDGTLGIMPQVRQELMDFK